jgi:APA family basic amino acid/polyamine antiporter
MAGRKLERALGIPLLSLYGIGSILGAGIYSVIGEAAGRSGGALWMSFGLAALIAGLTAASYAELATALPRAGAEYAYLRRAFPRWPVAAGATGLLLALSSAATAATVSIAFSGYLAELIAVPRGGSSFALLALLTAVAALGIQHSAWTAAVLTAIEAGGLVLVIAAGFAAPHPTPALSAAPGPGVIGAAALVFFAYLGFENVANLAEEAREPARALPVALLASLAISSLLYLGVALAVVALAPPEALAASDAPLASAVAAVWPRAGRAMDWIALCATANTALASLLTGSRLLYGAARGGDLPRPLAAVSRRKIPWVASLIVAAVAVALLPLGSVALVAGLSSFASLLAFFAVHAALVALRRREPGLERPFRVPFSIGRLPLLPLVGAGSSLLLVAALERAVLWRGALALAAVVAGCFAYQRRAAGRSL